MTGYEYQLIVDDDRGLCTRKASEVADAKRRASPTSLVGVGVARWLY